MPVRLLYGEDVPWFSEQRKARYRLYRIQQAIELQNSLVEEALSANERQTPKRKAKVASVKTEHS